MCYQRAAVLSVAGDTQSLRAATGFIKNKIVIQSASFMNSVTVKRILSLNRIQRSRHMLVRTHLDSNTFHLCYQKQRMSEILERIRRERENKVHSLQVVQERLLSLFPG